MNKVAIGTIIGTALLGLAKSRFGNKNETLIDMSEMISQGRVLGNGNFSIAVELDSDPDNVYLVSADPAKEFMVDMHKKYPDNPHIPTIEKVGYTRYQPDMLGRKNSWKYKDEVNFAFTNTILAQSPIYIYKTPKISKESSASCLWSEAHNLVPTSIREMSVRIKEGISNCREYTDFEMETFKLLIQEVMEHNKKSDIYLAFDSHEENVLYDKLKDIVIFNDIFFVSSRKEKEFFKARRALIPSLDPNIQYSNLFKSRVPHPTDILDP